MIKHLAKYGPTYISTVALVLGLLAQASQRYLSTHPTATATGFLIALALAIVNHWITSPKDFDTVTEAKQQSSADPLGSAL